jgi:hypothetical protein
MSRIPHPLRVQADRARLSSGPPFPRLLTRAGLPDLAAEKPEPAPRPLHFLPIADHVLRVLLRRHL